MNKDFAPVTVKTLMPTLSDMIYSIVKTSLLMTLAASYVGAYVIYSLSDNLIIGACTFGIFIIFIMYVAIQKNLSTLKRLGTTEWTIEADTITLKNGICQLIIQRKALKKITRISPTIIIFEFDSSVGKRLFVTDEATSQQVISLFSDI